MNKLDSILKNNQQIKDFKVFDVDTEWDSFKNLISQNEESEQDNGQIISADFSKDTNRQILYMLSFAASFILILAAIFVFNTSSTNESYISSAQANETVQLVDGSKVVLQQGASLKYFTSLDNAEERMLSLSGNAHFDISKSILPFKVFHKDIVVEVLGTTFNITESEKSIKIENHSGSVKVSEIKNKNNFKILKQGDAYIYKDGIFTDLKAPQKEIAIAAPAIAQPKNKTPEPAQVIAAKQAVEEKPAEEPAVMGSKYKLGSVVKDHLLKLNKKKIKLEKNSSLDFDAIVRLDLTKSTKEILDDLKKLGYIDFISGDCEDCYIIQAPKK